MNEITERPILNTFKQLMRAALVYPIPSNLRHHQFSLKPSHTAT
jgi:hypothetical protein